LRCSCTLFFFRALEALYIVCLTGRCCPFTNDGACLMSTCVQPLYMAAAIRHECSFRVSVVPCARSYAARPAESPQPRVLLVSVERTCHVALEAACGSRVIPMPWWWFLPPHSGGVPESAHNERRNRLRVCYAALSHGPPIKIFFLHDHPASPLSAWPRMRVQRYAGGAAQCVAAFATFCIWSGELMARTCATDRACSFCFGCRLLPR